MGRFSAVIFDFDGTVARTAEDVWGSVRYGFEQCGRELPAEFSGDNRNLFQSPGEMMELLYPGSGPALCQRVDQEVAHHYREVTTHPNTVLFPGIRELLELLLEEKIPTGILSNKAHPALGRVLELKGWGRYFTSYRGSLESDGDLGDKVHRLAEYKKQFDMSNAVYIGDSASDVIAAKANGFLSIGLLYGDGDGELVRQSGPDVLCAAPEELLAYFEKGCVSHAE